MERTEPTLVPEWLRSTGSVTGGGSSAHPFASSSSHSDVPQSVHHTRNRNSRSISDIDGPRSALLDRTSSSNSRRSSSNGSAKHAYSSFSRSYREKDREREKERSSFLDDWDRESSDPIGSILACRSEKDRLKRSQSMVSRKQGDMFTRRGTVDLKNGSNRSHNNGNGLLSGVSIGGSVHKAVFEKDFPSLGNDDKQGLPDVVRVASPGLNLAVQSLPVSSSALIGGEGWTSALAEVPTIVGSSVSSTGTLSVLQTVNTTSGSGTNSAMSVLNMAEALAQAPSRTYTAPPLSVKTQRLEELAIKKSRQLIPVTPSMPKGSILNSSDKTKPKSAVRTGEMSSAIKGGQQQSSSLVHANHSLQSGHVKSELPKSPHGNFLVLKQPRENGVSTPKDIASPHNNSARASSNRIAFAPPVASAPTSNPKLSPRERKGTASNLISGFPVEKRPTLLQTQSRNDFFNLLKKKTSMNTSASVPDSGTVSSSPIIEMSGEEVNAPVSPQTIENGAEVISNGDACKEVQRLSDVGEKNTSSSAPAYTEEEEAAFLLSLGWDGKEYSGDDEGLTEEEIDAFLREYIKLMPSLKASQGISLKLLKSHLTSLGGGSEPSSSDSGSEA
ncbi:hypothetical protein CFOL_v3_02858 [Cephalotus follicularis]|uniref:Uncharacterized protein n=1 Tax=Cephalotus follicularis TaxID=3775 RepID=A0A1Q3AUB1_CEPFO|nr:hypothetical protein CFOL_v3_02858 [Cephalotus follicularis]